MNALKERMREEVIMPALEEHKAKTNELCQKYDTEISSRVVSKIEMTQKTMQAMSRWADSIKKDVDPGLLLPAGDTHPS